MDLRFWRTKEPEVKATPLSPRLQAILEQGPMSFTPDGSVSFFDAFGGSYGKLYRSNSALRAVVDFLSRNIAQCAMKLGHRDAEGVSRPEPNHPVQQLLDHPQAGVARSRFYRQFVADKALYDVAAIWKIRENFDPTPDPATHRVRNTGVVRDLVRIPVPFIDIFQGSLSSPAEFRVTAGRDMFVLPATDVIWMPGYSPTSNTMGTPPVETLKQMLAEEWAAGKDRENYWKRGPQMHTVFLQDGSSADLTDEQAQRFHDEWQNRYGGVNAANAGAIPLIPSGLTPHEIAINAQTSEYVATRTLAREEVSRAYGIQPQLLGITPSNFASMDMYHQMLYQDTLAPWMIPIQEEFEEQLLREFETEDSGYYLDFNINAKLQGSFLEQAKIGQQAVGGPWMTRNEFREKFQALPPIDGGDDIVVPLNVALGGGPQANPQDAQNQFTEGKSLDLIKEPETKVQPVVVNISVPESRQDIFVNNQIPEQQPLPLTVNVEPPQVNVAAPITVESPSVLVTVPEQAPPTIHVEVPETKVDVHVPESRIDVHVPEQASPTINVESPAVNVTVPKTPVTVNVPKSKVDIHVPALEAPHIEVNVPETHVDVHVPAHVPDVTVNIPEPKKRRTRVVRDADGKIVGAEEQ